MEFLVVDFASDVEQQSVYTKSTQETVTLHVANQLQLRGLTHDDSVCVVNTGLHDERLCNGKSDKRCIPEYSTNVKKYLNLLYKVCGSIIWISTTPVQENPMFPQNNARAVEMNKLVNETMAKHSNGYFVEISNAASQYNHVDNVHFEPEYYVGLGQLFSSLM